MPLNGFTSLLDFFNTYESIIFFFNEANYISFFLFDEFFLYLFFVTLVLLLGLIVAVSLSFLAKNIIC